jgi:predicted dehydrogenase
VSLRAGVVGSSFGARIHVPALRQAGFEVVALVGTNAEKTSRRAERLGIPGACTSLTAALELGLDAVSIAGPPATHAPLASQAIAAGCHVLCEKPFTLDVAEAEGLVRDSDAAGVTAVLGHEFRWSNPQATIGWALESGLIGVPKVLVSASFIAMLRSFPMPAWWFEPAQGGGWLNASGSHRVDSLRQWFGEVAGVSAGLTTVSDPALGVDDTFTIRCTMRSGVDATVVQSGAAAGPGAGMTRLVGNRGTLWVQGDTVHIAEDSGVSGAGGGAGVGGSAVAGAAAGADAAGRVLEPPAELELPDVDALATGPLAAMTKMELPAYIRLAQAFRRAVEGEPPAAGPRPATFADGLACMRVLEAVRRSAADGGRWVEIADDT